MKRPALLKVSHILRINGEWRAEVYRVASAGRKVVKLTESSEEKFFEILPRLIADINTVRAAGLEKDKGAQA